MVDFKTLAKSVAKGLAQYARNCKVCSYFPYTLQLFVTSATIFSIDLYMGNYSHNYFLETSLQLCV